MAQPNLYFLYNKTNNDVPYTGVGSPDSNWGVMVYSTVSGVSPDRLVFTGGGINPALPTPTAPYGRREATLKPATGTLVIPQTYIESETNNIMYNVPLAGKNTNRYVFGVYVSGYIASDLYLEAWDNELLNSTNSPVLSGTVAYPHSMINAISATSGSPPSNWTGATYSGIERSAYLSGYDHRVRLKGADSLQNETVYFNIYLELPYDADYFHETPVLCFRYLYI